MSVEPERQRLARSREHRVISGVAGGVATYFNISPLVVRTLWVVAAVLMFPVTVLAYVALWIFLPVDRTGAPAPTGTVQRPRIAPGRFIAAFLLGAAVSVLLLPFLQSVRSSIVEMLGSGGTATSWEGQATIQNSAGSPNCVWQARITLDVTSGQSPLARLGLFYDSVQPQIDTGLACPGANATVPYRADLSGGGVAFADTGLNKWVFVKASGGRLRGSVTPADANDTGNYIYASPFVLSPVGGGSGGCDSGCANAIGFVLFVLSSLVITVIWLHVLPLHLHPSRGSRAAGRAGSAGSPPSVDVAPQFAAAGPTLDPRLKSIVTRIGSKQKTKDIFCLPTLRTFTAARTNVVFAKDEHGNCCVRFGPGRPPGITFTATVTLPSDQCSGNLEFVQNIVMHYERKNARGSTFPHECISSHGAWCLDSEDPFDHKAFPVKGVGPHTVYMDDSPEMRIDGDWAKMEHTFRMYLMWRPDGYTFRFAVGRLDWWVKGTATKSNPQDSQCNDGTNDFVLTSKPTDNGNEPGRSVDPLTVPVTLPTTEDIKANKWQKC